MTSYYQLLSVALLTNGKTESDRGDIICLTYLGTDLAGEPGSTSLFLTTIQCPT